MLKLLWWKSLPSRERGLKFINIFDYSQPLASLPSRERGLKWFVYAAKITGELVAPFAGAWIEIPDCCAWFPVLFVAPFAGAWIEISVTIHIITDVVRRSLRGSVD